MKRLTKHPFVVFQLSLMVVISAVLSIGLLACENDAATEPDEACGSGRVTWDSKAGVCRDDLNNTIVDPDCCGR